ncbi:LLM class flavin-dependent oxidoreductase [Sphingobium sp. YR768]|uniref:LLM class flavin-dependent oxidoreductase n=1 Tax=Sphingobium sp. YR768 TaxID=1884365 RepID=UPI0008CBC4F7|nr:LLM class flavin-dependent oxidoreductase [Sphingobium sp. YR768]SER80214.1 FMN-dependent oxidoreductase, nitrilotriacetate monooxygenase family [Sphingobium sp. YR768]
MSLPDRRMILATFIHNSGAHPGGWRYPGAASVDQHDFQHYARIAQTAERGKMHVYFSGDSQGYPHISGKDAFSATDYAGKLEPTTLLAALATVTRHIGLVATASTTYNEPYAIARRFASIDHISGGRAGWNVVTSASDSEARNFGRDLNMDHDARYARAEEFVDVVRNLWDSWEDGAVIRDQASARYFDPARVHQLDHQGQHFKVAGPLNIGRPPQGHPIIVQAGGSGPGRDLAARTADMIFTAANSLDAAKTFYTDMKQRAADFGRDPAKLLVIPSVQLMVRATEAEAKRADAELLDLVPEALALRTLQLQLGTDLSTCSPNDRLPDIALTNGGQWVQQQIIKMARDEDLTIGQLARRVVVSRASFSRSGTPEQIADLLENWFREGGADGFSLSPNYLPGGLEDFVDQVIPILQKRGLFRTDYEGATLRENLGLEKPANAFVADPTLGREPTIWA